MGKKIPCKKEGCTKLLGVREVTGVYLVPSKKVKVVNLRCSRCGTPQTKEYKEYEGEKNDKHSG